MSSVLHGLRGEPPSREDAKEKRGLSMPVRGGRDAAPSTGQASIFERASAVTFAFTRDVGPDAELAKPAYSMKLLLCQDQVCARIGPDWGPSQSS